MGKESKRRKDRDVIKQPRGPVPITPMFEPSGFALPPPFSLWDTRDQAIKGLIEDGWKHAKFVPMFSSAELCKQLTMLLIGTGVSVEDCTDSLSCGTRVDLTQYGTLVRNLEDVSTVRPDKIYILMRTFENTTSFLAGTTYVYTTEMKSKQLAVNFTKKISTPFVLGLFRGVHVVLPTLAAQGSPVVPAKIIAAMVKDDANGIECPVCCKSFLIRHDEHEFELKSFLISECDHAFHPQCVVSQINTGMKTCAVCSHQLPSEWLEYCATNNQTAFPAAPKVDTLVESVKKIAF